MAILNFMTNHNCHQKCFHVATSVHTGEDLRPWPSYCDRKIFNVMTVCCLIFGALSYLGILFCYKDIAGWHLLS